MSASVDKVLSRLPKYRKFGPGKWMAVCPAHDDRHPSLSIREAEDGKVLMHCWAGCSVEQIVSALNLSMADLFEDSASDFRGDSGGAGPLRKAFDYRDALTGVSQEATAVMLIASEIIHSGSIKPHHYDRLRKAESLISDALSVAGGR